MIVASVTAALAVSTGCQHSTEAEASGAAGRARSLVSEANRIPVTSVRTPAEREAFCNAWQFATDCEKQDKSPLFMGARDANASADIAEKLLTIHAEVRNAFRLCPGGSHLGQVSVLSETSCTEVCTVFGFDTCEYRAAQSNFDVCSPQNPARSGGCEDVFQRGWSSQCACR